MWRKKTIYLGMVSKKNYLIRGLLWNYRLKSDPYLGLSGTDNGTHFQPRHHMTICCLPLAMHPQILLFTSRKIPVLVNLLCRSSLHIYKCRQFKQVKKRLHFLKNYGRKTRKINCLSGFLQVLDQSVTSGVSETRPQALGG